MEKPSRKGLRGSTLVYGIKRLLSLGIFVAGFFCVTFVPLQVNAACVVDITGAIICTGTDPAGVTTGDSNDAITVEAGATVSNDDQQTIVTTATADTVTIDAGNGLNTVTNLGNITATTGAAAQPATGSASHATAGSTAVQTGDNADMISNVSTISSTAVSSATSPSISPPAISSVFSNTTQSDATAIGIDGGNGQNQITNRTLSGVTAHATSSSSAPVINVQVQDGASAQVNTIAHSESTGVCGEGSISNFGTITVTAASVANTGAARASVFGSATAEVFTRAQANATGITGSTNTDTIISEFILSAGSTATAEGSINLEGSATNVDIDASIRAEAATTGIDGNAGDDSITTSSIVTATSTADATSDSSGSSFWAPGVTDATTSSIAQTTGIEGGAGLDTIANSGIITAGAQATTEVSNLLTSYGIEKAVSTEAKGGASSSATAFGIDGGDDADAITNNGIVNTTATATTTSTGVLLTYFGLGMFSIPTTASAQSMGIDGGDGNDTIVNMGLLTSTSTATASTTGVSVSGLQYDVLTEGDSSVTAASTATGISGGTGDDTISNAGTVTVLGNATASATRVGVEAVGSSRLDADTEADATAVGIAGGSGDDHITNETGGFMTVNANPTATSTSVDVRMIGVPTIAYEFFAKKDLDSARTVTQATATGIDGGAGDDTITNNGTIVVGTSADTDSHTWSVTITPPLNPQVGVAVISALGASIGTLWADRSGAQSDPSRRDALITAGTGAVATTVGIMGGDGADTITNNGSLTANATADAHTVGVTLSLGFGRGGVMSILPSVALVDGTTTAKATATGIDGGTGDDHIYQNNTLNVTSNAYATNTGIGIDFKGSWGPGFAWGGTISDSSTTAASGATGIVGGEGDDTITNSGAHGITIISGADADSTTVSATVMWASQGVAGGITYVDDSTTAQATSVGIDGGSGTDTITSNAGLTTSATAESTSAVVSLSVAGTETGVSLNAALADASLTATSSATGITAGSGNDQVTNTDAMTVTSSADVDSASVSVGLGFAQTGITAGVAAADISVTANSAAIGIDGASGDDTLTSSGSMTTAATSTVSAAGVSVQAGYAISGVAVGGALVKGESVATATATGMEGASGDDTLTNSGINTVSATSNVTAASVGVDFEGTSAGLAAGASAVDGNNTVHATAMGLSGGAGSDNIYNYNQTTVSAVTDSTRTSVSVTGTFALEGMAAGAAFAFASNTATATAIGIDGGDGDETIVNNANLQTDATTTVTTASVSIDVSISVEGVSGGASVAEASSTGNAYSTGIAGGFGNDTIENQNAGVISGTTTATAEVTGVSVTIATVGFSSTDVTTNADAGFTGIAGAAGVDTIHNHGTVDIDAVSTATGRSGSGTIVGYSSADAGITATSTSIGMDGGDGNDTVANHHIIDVTSTATSTGLSVTVDLLGAGFANASTTANTYATGLAGGAGNDTLDNGGSITLTATSDVDQTGVSVVLGGYSDSDGSNTSLATITGMDGGAGDDTMTNYTGSTITGTATAKGEVVNVPISLLGDSNADGTTTATANAYGMAGAAGVDTMHNFGTINIDAVSTPDGTAGGGTIGGYGEADVTITATSTSIGMDGGDGNDTVANHHIIDVTSTATSTGLSVTVDLLGAGFANASTTANTYATGLAGGAGNDTLDNGGSITLTATSDVDQTGVSVVLGGYSDSDGSNTSLATITGMDGGAGDDTMTNYTGSTITGTATAKGEVVNVPISLLGDSNADGTTTATANAYGMAGAAGVDTMHNFGTINIDAVSTPAGTAGGGTIGGYGEADVTITATSTSIGMDGGDGNDTVANHHIIDVTSTATSTGLSVTVDLLGAGFANASTTANTYATGLAGGAGNDTLDNGGSITLTATSDVDQTGVSVVLGGYSDSDGSNTSLATITGMDGGAGDDTMTNYTGSTITGTATAKGEVVNVPISLLGDSNADGTTTATANAYGMAGAAGVDTMHNFGTINIDAVSTPDGTAGGATIGGYGEADVTITATSTSIGMDGGDGNDTVANHHIIDVTSTATSTGLSVTVDLLGAGFANASTTANTYATGLAGGAGNDTLDNGGSITLTATSDVDQTGVSVVLGGYSDSDGSNTSLATITGMDGGAGDDTMTNYTGSTITGTATAKGEVVNVPISLLGDSNADGTTTATANAYGMAGAAGVDTMHNFGTITITANSTPTGLSVAGTLGGYGEADVSIAGTSTSVGIDGGDGDDTVANHNVINVKSTATSKGVSVTVEMFGGAGYADAGTTANTYATGLAGGAGNDTIDNSGTINLTATSKVTQTGVSVTLGGEASSNGTNAAHATLIGMDGSDGDDILTNYANGHVTIVDDQITLDPTAKVYMSSTTVELAGDQRADGGATATATAYGMGGGAGNDTVQNAGAITVNISSAIYGSATSAQLFGDGESNTSGTSNTTVVGMDGGEGDNTIRNFSTGIIALTATATGQAGGYTLELGGDGDATAGTNATASAYGMRAGIGTDYLYNYGTIGVTASSTLTDSSSAYTLFGTSTASSNDTAASTAVGMDAGNGVNTVLNASGAHLTVDATASASAQNGTKTFGGTAQADANSTATSTAKGITGGTGGDVITNNGDMDIDAYAFAKAVTNAALFAGHAIANSTGGMTATAVGIDAGDGQNSVTNNQSITADATAEVSIYSKADTDFDKTISNAQSSSDVAAFGIRTGNGDSTVTNGESGTIVVHSYARSLSFTVDGEGDAVQHTTAVSDEDANATAVFSSNATGIRSGDGNSTIMNLGTITVAAETTPDSHARASSTQYTATATSRAGGSATATGIRAGNGNNIITSNGPLTVTATNTGTALADYTSTHLDSAIAYAGAGDVSLTSSATGVSIGNGANTIEIRGNMTVTSTLTSNAHGHSNTDWADNKGEAYAGGTATATGISVGDGQNTIRNYGTMTVTASATVSAFGDGEDAATARATSEANAVGITSGNGNNSVTNYGTISVSTARSATASVSVGSDTSTTENASAIGIRTGSGNDVVTNYGTIMTTQPWTVGIIELPLPGTAITTGAGNDTVVLGAGSATTGTIDLGTGDDTLTFLGTATINGSLLGNILPGTGSNSLVFDGAGTLGYDFSGFENTTKQGTGTFTLAGLPTMRNLTINQGALQVNSNYAMADNSAFRTYVNGNNGGAGLLSVNGTASLAGALTVVKGRGYFYNGSVYDIITGNSVTGAFSGVTLPQSTPLLSFSMLQSPTAVQVTTHARSFTTFASNPVEWAVADYLDRIQHTNSDDLLTVLAEIQNLPASQLSQAFSSLGPQAYDASTRASYFGSWQNTGSLQRRMGNVRSYGLTGQSSRSKPLLLAFAGSDAALDRFFTAGQLSQAQNKSGLWLNGYQQRGNQQEKSYFTGYDYNLYGGTLGFDRAFSDELMAGISIGRSRTSVNLDDNWGEGDIKNTTGSLYGSYFTKHAYVEGDFSYGKNKYSNYRYLTIGSIQRRADSDHDGDVFSAYLGGGYLFNVNKWTIGPFGSLIYVNLNEEGFTETGAYGLNLTVDRRKTDSLISELGLRASRVFKTNSGDLIPELTAALNYDFDIDDRVITASFSGSPDAAFSVKGQKAEKYGATMGVGLTFIHKSGVSTSLEYRGEFREKYQSHGLMGQLRIAF